MQLNTSGVCPINLFAEYCHMLKQETIPANATNVHEPKAYERFRIGLSFSLGLDR